MEPAGRVVSKLKPHGLTDEQLASAAWPRAVGKKIALRTRVLELVRDRLVVEVEDKVWRSQLLTLQNQILGRLAEVLGRSMVTKLEFRIAIPKREVVREERHDHRAMTPPDEADAIADPVMRRIYIASRRKAN
jgi:predicted nucleic acid-binding Zn ribbon protein